MQKIAVYLSKGQQLESLDEQIEKCQQFAEDHFGNDLAYEFYIDTITSQDPLANRSELNRLIEDIKNEKIKGLITWQVSHISTSISLALKFLEEKVLFYKVPFFFLKENVYDTPADNMKFKLLCVLSENQFKLPKYNFSFTEGIFKKWVAFYIRVSTKKQAKEGYSLDGQFDECLKKAREIFGPDVCFELYVDGGISAKSAKGRPELQRMLKDLRNKKVMAVITWKVDRLARNLSDALKLVEEIDSHSVDFISIKEGKYGSPSENLTFNILSTVAQYQRETLAENVQLGMTQRAKEGGWNGGIVLGYKSNKGELSIIPEEAKIVKLIFQKFVEETWGTKKITSYLNLCGYHTKKGKPFSVNAVKVIIENPIYKGFIRFNQVIDWNKEKDGQKHKRDKNKEHMIIRKGKHEAIVSEEVWDKAQEIRLQRATGIPRQYTGNFPLTGLAKCPECGGYMTSSLGSRKKDKSRLRYYICGSFHNCGKSVCNSNIIRADKLEDQVWSRIVQALTSEGILSDLVGRINGKIAKPMVFERDDVLLKARLENLNQQKARIQEAYESGIYTPDETTIRMSEIRSKISELEQEIINTESTFQDQSSMGLKPITVDDIRKQIEDFLMLKDSLDAKEFRQLLEATIESVIIENKSLKHINFSFIIPNSISESEYQNSDSLHQFYILNGKPRLPKHKSVHPSPIRFTVVYLNEVIYHLQLLILSTSVLNYCKCSV